jgi:thioester reductase-like protein
MKKRYLVTGATGLIGSYLLKMLLQDGHKVYVLARGNSDYNAKRRVENILNFWDKTLLVKHSESLKILEGDIVKKNLGSEKNADFLHKVGIDEVFHCAATTEFNRSFKEIRKVNIDGTKNVLDFCIKYSKNGFFKKINYLSTAFVCGDYRGVFKESNLDVRQNFVSSYEQSKFEAEKLIEKYRENGLWIDIFRPALVIGESKTGKTFSFHQSFYQVLHIWDLEIFTYFPGKNIAINVVFVDELCESIIKITFNGKERNKNYHTFPQKRVSLEMILNISSEILKFKKPKLIGRDDFIKKEITPVQSLLLKNNIFNYNNDAILDSHSTNSFLERCDFKFSNLTRSKLEKLIDFSTKIGYLKKYDN